MNKSNRLARIFIVDWEGNGHQDPIHGDAREFGSVHLTGLETFHGKDTSKETFERFAKWIYDNVQPNGEGVRKAIFVSDNNGYDYMWTNHYFVKHLGFNPFGPFSRRIGDFWAGLQADWEEHSEWKRLRDTKHDHNPVHDSLGNAEALLKMLKMAESRKLIENDKPNY